MRFQSGVTYVKRLNYVIPWENLAEACLSREPKCYKISARSKTGEPPRALVTSTDAAWSPFTGQLDGSRWRTSFPSRKSAQRCLPSRRDSLWSFC